ncbi:hypothetical protein [Pseudoalteromonas phenolica]|uniref:hypothetical protein n=1 Tax=Pseudoalteromonas phenolica TaxID=161398 RepID=UPI001BB2B332|nr:hypothetical protein [Pseudoalteromonas phenolica]
MSKIFYKRWSPKQESLQQVSMANSIIEEYEKQGYTLTLRQLYYQFVARDLIENSERSYKNLGALVTKARMAGLISWEAIEDRNREHQEFWFQENAKEVVESLPHYIRYDRWERQPCYVEVWVEKEALGNVVSRACSPLLVPHMSCKGYLSASEAWRAGQRFEDKISQHKRCIVIHLGDHDPSGIDMTRDNQDRLDLFNRFEERVEVVRIALNRDQIDEFNPPPNPAKITDSRAKEYIRRHGQTSWELDALEPSVMEKMISDEINKYIDIGLWNEVGKQQKETKEMLSRLHQNWNEVQSIIR